MAGKEGAAKLPRTSGEPRTARNTWERFRAPREKCAAAYGVPVELILATACTESGGNPDRTREEPGYRDDESTPDRVSLGLMQTLISTARAAVGEPGLDRHNLLDPEGSIRAGTAYIKQQAVNRKRPSNFDPPLVAIAYNAGPLRHSEINPWGLVQTDRGGDHFHADAFVEYFNDIFAILDGARPSPELLDTAAQSEFGARVKTPARPRASFSPPLSNTCPGLADGGLAALRRHPEAFTETKA